MQAKGKAREGIKKGLPSKLERSPVIPGKNPILIQDNIIKLEHYYSPGELEAHIAEFVNYYNNAGSGDPCQERNN